MENAERAIRRCESCGASVPENDKFCISCGATLQRGGSTSNAPSSNAQVIGNNRSDNLKRMVGGAYEKSKSTYQQANTRYRQYAENQAVERERREKLQAEEQQHQVLRTRFVDHETFLLKARDGSAYFLDWWRAYESSDSTGEQQTECVELLQTAIGRAQKGLEQFEGPKQELYLAVHDEDLRKKLGSSLNGLRVKQENLDGTTSIFPPLVLLHEKIGDRAGWRRFRNELEAFVRDLEDMFDSPTVKTNVANRARFADPSGNEVKSQGCPRCGLVNAPTSAFCYNCGVNLGTVPGSLSAPLTDRRRVSPSQTDPIVWIVLSIVCALVSLLFLPPLTGGLGVFFAYRAKQAGSEAGGISLMVVCGLCALMGMLFGGFYWGF